MNLKSCNHLKRISEIPEKIGQQFYSLGFFIASNPWRTIFASFVLFILFAAGNLNFYFERKPLNLWVPRNDRFKTDTEYLFNHFQTGYRQETVLITAKNILVPKNLKKATIIDQAIKNLTIQLSNGTMAGYEELCLRIPFIVEYVEQWGPLNTKFDPDFDGDDFFKTIYLEENITDASINLINERPYNPAIDMAPGLFCEVVNNLPTGCREISILELWKYNTSAFDKLTLNDTLFQFNNAKTSPVTGYPVEHMHLLSGVINDTDGHVISAASMLMHYYLFLNVSDIDHEKIANDAGTEEYASVDTLAWEKQYIQLLKKLQMELNDGDFTIYFISERSQGDSTAEDFNHIIVDLAISSLFMFIYMQIVLSTFNWTGIRFILVTIGLICIGLAVIITCGICSFIGVPYTPIHTSFPLLIMSLGVDDMFVMMANWNKVEINNSESSIPEKIGLMLQHAGVSITITSFTNIVAFLIGITTIVPVLQSYCIYSAIGVFVMYVLVITLYVAVFTLDVQRIAARRNPIFPCIVMEGKSKQNCCDSTLLKNFLKFVYNNIILTVIGKICVIILAIGFTVIGGIGITKLEQHTDSKWLYTKNSYPNRYENKHTELYPDDGFEGEIVIGDMDFRESLDRITQLSNILDNRTDYLTSFDSWVKPLDDFVHLYFDKDIYSPNITDLEWREYFGKFLYSQEGGKYQARFKFEKDLECDKPISKIEATVLHFVYRPQNSTETYRVRHDLQRIIEETMIHGDGQIAASWSKIHGIWQATEIMNGETSRNVFLAFICVIFCTSLLIINLQMCFWILMCVVCTLVSVAGFVQILGMKIDIVVNLSFLLAVGLCVDYAAHIGHTFLTMTDGTRSDRALNTVVHIAGAIIHGAGSTLLAMSMLAVSEINISFIFFKQVALILGFGLFYGIVLLPVVLSLIGPSPYDIKKSIDTKL